MKSKRKKWSRNTVFDVVCKKRSLYCGCCGHKLITLFPYLSYLKGDILCGYCDHLNTVKGDYDFRKKRAKKK